jgi:hypothetical protein
MPKRVWTSRLNAASITRRVSTPSVSTPFGDGARSAALSVAMSAARNGIAVVWIAAFVMTSPGIGWDMGVAVLG